MGIIIPGNPKEQNEFRSQKVRNYARAAASFPLYNFFFLCKLTCQICQKDISHDSCKQRQIALAVRQRAFGYLRSHNGTTRTQKHIYLVRKKLFDIVHGPSTHSIGSHVFDAGNCFANLQLYFGGRFQIITMAKTRNHNLGVRSDCSLWLWKRLQELSTLLQGVH